jgi:hypothetical protein
VLSYWIEEVLLKLFLRSGALLLGASLILAACASTEGDAALDEALDALNGSVSSLNDSAQELQSALDDLEVRIEMVESTANGVALDFFRIGPSRAAFLPAPPDGKVTVQFVAESIDAAIPGTFRFFLAPEGEALFETASLTEGETFEVGPELVDGIVPVDPGVLYMLKIVYENPTAEAMDFLVPGGTLDPQAALPYVRNRCWCAALPFNVPANGTFTRVIQVGVGPDTPPGARAVMVWPVVRLDS